MKISVSLLSAYLFCPRKLFLQKVLAMKEPPKESLVLGTIRHEVYDHVNKSEEKIVSKIQGDFDYDNIIALYKENYAKKVREIILKNWSRIRQVNMDTVSVFKRTWPYIMHEVEERSRNIHLFMLENKVYGNELWEKLTPKILSELKVESESLQLRGIVDRVEIYERGYVPIELKTGKMPKEGMWPGHRIQIAAYTLLLEEKFNKEIKECFVNYLDAGARRQLTMNPFMKEEIIELVNEIQNLLEKKNIPTYTENRNKCVNCGLKERCHDEEEVRTLITHTT